METPTVIHSTFVIERNYPATPERVFAALADPAKKRRWFAEGEHHTVDTYHLDFRVGGHEHYASHFHDGHPLGGLELTNQSTYQDIVLNRRVLFTASMTIAGKCISVSVGTMELLPAGKGTDLVFTFQSAFLEGSGGPAMREEGWRKLLENLAVELARDEAV